MVVSEPTDTGWFSGYRTADTVVFNSDDSSVFTSVARRTPDTVVFNSDDSSVDGIIFPVKSTDIAFENQIRVIVVINTIFQARMAE
jgi:hypothetical protein